MLKQLFVCIAVVRMDARGGECKGNKEEQRATGLEIDLRRKGEVWEPITAGGRQSSSLANSYPHLLRPQTNPAIPSHSSNLRQATTVQQAQDLLGPSSRQLEDTIYRAD